MSFSAFNLIADSSVNWTIKHTHTHQNIHHTGLSGVASRGLILLQPLPTRAPPHAGNHQREARQQVRVLTFFGWNMRMCLLSFACLMTASGNQKTEIHRIPLVSSQFCSLSSHITGTERRTWRSILGQLLVCFTTLVGAPAGVRQASVFNHSALQPLSTAALQTAINSQWKY